jgi:flagellar hook-associated protein 2
VTDVNSTTASGLHLTGASVAGDYGGTPSNLIDGSITRTIQLDSADSLEDLRAKIAALNAGVLAGTYNDGSSRPYHLALTSQRSGRLGQLVIDTSGIDSFALTRTTRGRDALLSIGGSGGSGAGVLLASGTNRFTDALPGVTLEVKQSSSSPVTVSVNASDADVVASVETMVTNYNKFREQLNDSTAYDSQQNATSVLTGDSVALQLDTELSRLLTRGFLGVGSIQSLGELGVTMNDDGTLAFDQTVLQAKFAADPEGVQDFFATEDTGFSAMFAQLAEQLSGEDVSLLANRFKSLDRKITENQSTIDSMNARLAKQRERLTLQFSQLEAAISKLQSTLTLLDSIQPISVSSGSSASSTSRSSTNWSTPTTSGS